MALRVVRRVRRMVSGPVWSGLGGYVLLKSGRVWSSLAKFKEIQEETHFLFSRWLVAQ